MLTDLRSEFSFFYISFFRAFEQDDSAKSGFNQARSCLSIQVEDSRFIVEKILS